VAARKQAKAPAARAARKPARRPGAPRAPRPPPLPDPGGAAPLHELTRDRLSVFLYLALLPEETAALVKAWGLSQPGFRREALGEVQRCDLLADEVRAAPERGEAVLDLLRKAFGGLPMAGWHLDPPGAGELLDVAGHEAALALSLWRVLADRSAEVREAASPTLDRQVERFYGPAEAGAAAEGAAPPGRPAADGGAGPEERIRKLTGQLAAAQRQAEEAGRKAEEARLRGEEAREKLQGQLREARAREAQSAEEAARAREAAEAARQGLNRAEERLAALRAEDAVAEAQRARAAARDLEARAASLEARVARAQQREAELERDLARARGAAAPAPLPAAPAPAEEADGEEAQALWLFPVYTREFYDSLEGWDRRIQRAAFKQAHLLAQDHRHPSLRALPLEGLPGYYRVRVATDVRLLYRRGERQNAVEILSLIDREDLDRYVRQAKTRQS
jgi:mRNA-degrading endonuclease RelE of RelBE toxin-antitoxin system